MLPLIFLLLAFWAALFEHVICPPWLVYLPLLLHTSTNRVPRFKFKRIPGLQACFIDPAPCKKYVFPFFFWELLGIYVLKKERYTALCSPIKMLAHLDKLCFLPLLMKSFCVMNFVPFRGYGTVRDPGSVTIKE